MLAYKQKRPLIIEEKRNHAKIEMGMQSERKRRIEVRVKRVKEILSEIRPFEELNINIKDFVEMLESDFSELNAGVQEKRVTELLILFETKSSSASNVDFEKAD